MKRLTNKACQYMKLINMRRKSAIKTYADLDLKKIRDDCGLDFARHTYSKRQCSCCNSPLDMPAKYWAKGKKPKKINVKYNEKGDLVSYQWDRNIDDISYIIFDNAYNGRGAIKSLEEPIYPTCIECRFVSVEQKDKVCHMLQEQLGDEYIVIDPDNGFHFLYIKMRDPSRWRPMR